MDFIADTSAALPQDLLASVGRFRHQVFVEVLNWKLECRTEGQEQDQFDRDDTVYVVARDDAGNVNGFARLLPTVRPYLLGDVFPQLLHGQPVPATETVWELSRFAAVDFAAAKTTAMSQFSSPIAVGVLKKALEAAGERGAERLITVSPLGVERLLRRAGFHAHRAAPPLVIDGHPLFACWIEVDQAKAPSPATH